MLKKDNQETFRYGEKELTAEEVFQELCQLFPDAHCELNHKNLYELLVAIMLSAQTTDKQVNIVTPNLFESFPTMDKLAEAKFDDVYTKINRLGLAKTKAIHLIAMAKVMRDEYLGVFPKTMDELLCLPGVGRKTANVFLSEGYQIPRIAVDTHVERVSKRLGLVCEDCSTKETEEKLMSLFREDEWICLHHTLIFFGRYFCKAKNPLCEKCPFSPCTKK
jgi:endonuclease-3